MGQISSLHPRGRCRTRKEKNIRCCVAKLRGNLLVQVFPSETQNALPSLLGSPLGADELKLRTGEGQPQGANEYRQEGRFVLRRLRTSGLIAYYADQEYRQFASAKRTSE